MHSFFLFVVAHLSPRRYQNKKLKIKDFEKGRNLAPICHHFFFFFTTKALLPELTFRRKILEGYLVSQECGAWSSVSLALRHCVLIVPSETCPVWPAPCFPVVNPSCSLATSLSRSSSSFYVTESQLSGYFEESTGN